MAFTKSKATVQLLYTSKGDNGYTFVYILYRILCVVPPRISMHHEYSAHRVQRASDRYPGTGAIGSRETSDREH